MLIRFMISAWNWARSVTTWTPGLKQISTPKCKEIYKEFQYTLYSSMLTKALAGNIIFHFFLLLENFFHYQHGGSEVKQIPQYTTASIAFVFHSLAIALQYFRPKCFRNIYFGVTILSMVLIYTVSQKSDTIVSGSLINTCSTILFLLVATTYFQNSTVLLALSCLAKLILNMYGRICVVFTKADVYPGSIAVQSEVCHNNYYCVNKLPLLTCAGGCHSFDNHCCHCFVFYCPFANEHKHTKRIHLYRTQHSRQLICQKRDRKSGIPETPLVKTLLYKHLINYDT